MANEFVKSDANLQRSIWFIILITLFQMYRFYIQIVKILISLGV